MHFLLLSLEPAVPAEYGRLLPGLLITAGGVATFMCAYREHQRVPPAAAAVSTPCPERAGEDGRDLVRP